MEPKDFFPREKVDARHRVHANIHLPFKNAIFRSIHPQESIMPIINIEGPPIADINVRRKLVAELTTAAARAYALPEEKIIVLIRENTPEQVAVGGKLIADLR
jgi:4-oxalocrotonate tautomerase